MSEHTPLPWDLHIRRVPAGACKPGIWIDGPNHKTVVDTGAIDSWPLSPEDAEFITRACNCHDELLAALRDMVAMFDHYDPTEGQSEAFDRATAIIAKAEAT